MLDQESKEVWEELKDIWKNSSRTAKIHIQMSGLVDELKGKISQFEKDSINKDIATITGSISQFEKDSITRDITKITALIRKIIRRFRIKK